MQGTLWWHIGVSPEAENALTIGDESKIKFNQSYYEVYRGLTGVHHPAEYLDCKYYCQFLQADIAAH